MLRVKAGAGKTAETAKTKLDFESIRPKDPTSLIPAFYCSFSSCPIQCFLPLGFSSSVFLFLFLFFFLACRTAAEPADNRKCGSTLSVILLRMTGLVAACMPNSCVTVYLRHTYSVAVYLLPCSVLQPSRHLRRNVPPQQLWLVR